MAKQLNVDVNLNTAKAEAALKNLQQLLTQAIQGAGQGGNGALTKEIVKATQEAAKLKTMLANATDTRTGQLNLAKFNQQLSMNGTNLQSYSKSLMSLGPAGEKAFLGLAKSVVSTQAPVKQANTMLTQLGTTLKNTARWQLSSTMLHAFIGGIQNAFSYARGLNDSLNSIRIVTGQSADQMDRFAESANKSAKALSTSTLDYTDAALIYYQQGIRDDAEIKARTDATIKMANVTGQSAEKVSQQMTAIWNNFADGATNLEYFADVITALGANTASSSTEIATGLEKFAAVAETVGLSYEYATSALATITATTRQSADVVGTALKTLFARIQDLDLGETLEDGTTLGKYSQALAAVGISIKDQNGELRSMDAILDDMGEKWTTLNKDQQVALAQTVAGTRQYTQLVALMDNWDFMKQNLEIAYDAEGTLTQQQEIYEESWKAAKERVKASMQGLTTDLIDDDFFIGFNNVLAEVISSLDHFVDALGGVPGLLGLIGVVATKAFGTQLGQRMDNVILKLKEMTGMAQAETTVMQQSMAAQMSRMAFNQDGAMGAETRAIQRSIELSSILLSKKEQLTQADLQQAQALIEVSDAYGKQAVAAAQAADQAENNYLKEKQLAEQRMMRVGQQQAQAKNVKDQNMVAQMGTEYKNKFAEATASTEKMVAASEKIKAAFKSLGEGDAGIRRLKQGMEELRSAFHDVKLATPELKAALQAFNEDASIRRLIAAEKELAQAKKEVAEADAAKKALPKNASQEEEIAATEKLTNAKKRLEAADKEYQAARESGLAAANKHKAAILEDVDAIEKYISALAKKKGLDDTQTANLRKLIPSMQAEKKSYEEMTIALEREAEVAMRTKQILQGMTASAQVSKMGQSMVSALGAVSSLSMGISSLKSAVDTLNSTDLTFGEKLLQVSMSGSMGLSMLLMGLMSLPAAFSTIGTAASSGLDLLIIRTMNATKASREAAKVAYAEAKAAGASGAALRQTALGATNATDATKKLSVATKGLIANFLTAAIVIAAVVAVIAALIKVMNEAKAASPEGKLQAASKAASEMSSKLQEAKTAAEDLNSAFDKYNSINDKLKSCTRGTQEWTEALRENNNEVLELLTKYPQLSKIEGALIKNSDGSLSISKDAMDTVLKTAQSNVEALTWGQLMAQQQVTEASQVVSNLDLAKEIRNEIDKGQKVTWGMVGKSQDGTQESKFDIVRDGLNAPASFSNQEAIGRREEGGAAPEWARKDAVDVATEAIVQNFDKLMGKTTDEMEGILGDIFEARGLKREDAGRWATALFNSDYREQLAANVEAQAAQQKAAQAAGAGMVQTHLAADDQFAHNKNLDIISGALGNFVSEATKEAKNNIIQEMESDSVTRKEKGKEFAEMLGLNPDSVVATGTGIKYMDASGEWAEATNEMVAAALAAAEGLNGVGEAAAGINNLLNGLRNGNDEGQSEQVTDDMINSFMKNGDLSEANFDSMWNAAMLGPQAIEGQVDQLLGQVTEEMLKGTPWEGQLDDFREYFKNTTMDEIKGFADTLNNLTPIQQRLLEANSNNIHSMQDFQDKVLKASQVTDTLTAALNKVPQSYNQLAEDATNTASSMQYLNDEFVNHTKLTDEQRNALLALGKTNADIDLALDENGFITNAKLLNDYVDELKQAKKAEIDFAKAQLQGDYHQLTQAFKEELAAAAEADGAIRDMHLARAQAIQAQLQALEGLIAKYTILNSVIAGTKESIDKIAEARSYDESLDLTGTIGTEFTNYGKMVTNGEYGFARDQFVETFVPKEYRGSQSEIDRYLGENVMQYMDVDAKNQSMSLGHKGAQQFLDNLEKYKFGSFDETGGFSFSEDVQNGKITIDDIIDTDGINMTRELFDGLMSSVLKYTDNGAELFQQLFANSSDLNDQIYANDLAFNQAGEDFAEYLEQVREGNEQWDPERFNKYSDAIAQANAQQKTLGETAAQNLSKYVKNKDNIEAMSEALSKTDATEAVNAFNEIAGTDFSNVEEATQYFLELYDLVQNPPTGAELDLGIETLQQQLQQADELIQTLPNDLKNVDFSQVLAGKQQVFDALPEELQTKLKSVDPEIDVKINNIDIAEGDIPGQIQQILGDSQEHITKTLDILEGENTATTAWQEVQDQGDPDPVEYVINGNNEAARQAWQEVNGWGNPKGGTYTIKATVDWSGVPAEMRPSRAMGNFGFHKMQGSLNFGAKAFGNSFAGGKMGSLSSPAHSALVGELGQELVVDPHSGMYYTVGDSGAEFVDLPKDAIVFNHRQTEQLLKYDKINTRGQALIQGNAFGGGAQDKNTTHVDNGNANWFNTMNSYSNGQKPSSTSSSSSTTSDKAVDNSKKVANNTQTAAAAAGEFVEYQEEALKILRLEVDWYKELNRQVSKLNHELKSLSRNNDRLTGQAWFDNYEKQLKIMDQVWKKDKEISKKRQEDYKDTLKQLTYNNEIQYQYKALSSHSDDKSNKYNTLAATSDVNAIQTLLDYGKLDNSAVTLDANGNLLSINDVTALQEAALTGYNADVDKYNEMIGREDLTEAQKTEAENFKNYYEAKWKKINELIDEATTREEEMYKAIEDAQDALEAMHDLAQQAIVKRLELKVSVTDSATKILDFKMRRLQGSVSAVADSMQKLYNFSNSELFVAIDRLFNPDSTASTNFYKKGEDKFSYILTNLSAYADFYYESEDAVNRLFSDPKAITSESDRENLIKFIEGATGELNKLLDLVDDMGKKGTEVIEQFSKQISTLTSVMSSNVSILEHFKNLADLLGLSSDYDLLEGIVESQLEANKTMWKTAEEELVAAKSYRDNALEVYQGLVDSGDVKAAEFYKTSMLEPAEKYYEETLSKAQQATIKYAQSIQDKWTTTMEKIMSSWEKTATLGSNFDALTKSMEKAKSISSLLVTETNKLYETNTLLRKLNQDINKTDSLASKEKLQAFALEIQNRQKDNKMTKDSLDILKARYELLQAEMALEDAKNAKSTVRLQRDNEGNYGYVYTADQDDIADAEQNLADKQNDLYNLVLNQQQDNYERMIQSRQEYLARVKEIMNDATIDETERTRQLNEARRQFEEEWSIYDANMLESAYYLNKEATEGISEAWNTQFADRTLKTEEWVALCDEKEQELKVLLDDINAKREEVKNDTVTGLGDIKQRTKDIIDENDKLSKQITQSIIPTMTNEMNAVSNLTEAFSKQIEKIDELIDYYQDLINKAQEALTLMSMVDRSNMSYDHSEKMNEYYMQGDLEGWSSENPLRSDVAKNMSKHGGYMTNNLELAAFQIYSKENGLDWTDVRDSAWSGNTNFTGTGSDVINYMGSQGNERSHNNASDQTPLVQYILDTGNEQMLVGMNLDQYNMDESVRQEAKRKQEHIASGATGMYTGEWGDEGKLAILHEKELVLNAADTENILDTVNMLREITRQIDIRSAWTNMIADMAAPSLANIGNDTIQQEVHITAEFPNAQDKNEILDAFKSLVNEAAQFANRY